MGRERDSHTAYVAERGGKLGCPMPSLPYKHHGQLCNTGSLTPSLSQKYMQQPILSGGHMRHRGSRAAYSGGAAGTGLGGGGNLPAEKHWAARVSHVDGKGLSGWVGGMA